ncbi:MAG: serine/threonine-protein kinase [Planctomycetota bacterium]
MASGDGDRPLPRSGDPAAGPDHVTIIDFNAPAEVGRPGLPERIGKYRILHELGRGAMGSVFLAEDPDLGRRVAVKTMIAGEDAGEAAIARFLAEERSAGKLRHPGIVPIHEVGRMRAVYYMVMDYIEGRTLKDLIAMRDLTPARAAAIIRDTAIALDYAHGRHVIHRDLKPANIIVQADGRVFLMDFGLARNLDTDASLTHSGEIMGTPSYLNPEQAAGRSNRVDARSDVYSLGAVFYEALAGRPPVQGDTLHEVVGDVLDLRGAVRTRRGTGAGLGGRHGAVGIPPPPFAPRHQPGTVGSVCRRVRPAAFGDRGPGVSGRRDGPGHGRGGCLGGTRLA